MGIWGSIMNTYFKYLEKGTDAMKAGAPLLGPRGKATRKDGPAWRGGSWAPTLAPEATLHYPKLSSFISDYFMKRIS